MFGKKRNVTTRDVVRMHETQYRKEIAAVILLGGYAFLALAFFSFSQADNTLFHYSSGQGAVTNWAGVAGANIAAMFFYLFGAAAYVLLLSLLFPIGLLFFAVPLREEWRRLLGMNAMVIVVATLCALYPVWLLHGVAGGFVGAVTRDALLLVAGAQGGAVVLWGTFLVLLIGLLRIPLVALTVSALRAVGRWAWAYTKSFYVWVLRRKPADAPALATTTGGATRTRDGDETFWSQLADAAQDGTVVAHEQPEAPARLSQEKIDRLAACVLRRTSQHIKVLSTPLALIPNTVLSRHLFVQTEGTSVYDRLLLVSVPHAASVPDAFLLPDASLFKTVPVVATEASLQEQMQQRAKKLEEKLEHFGIKGSVVSIKPGPVVTMFEYKPEIDSKISKIIALEDDLAMALTAHSMRILAPIPGRNVIGFEIANAQRSSVGLQSILASDLFSKSPAALPIVLGVDIAGSPVVVDLASMPHLLVGGATGSGKSVGLNTMLLSLLCKRTPDELKLILIDPKRLEFTPYANIPHLLFPIVTQPTQASAVLAWVVQEMEERYAAMAKEGVRSVAEYRKVFAKESAHVLRQAQDERATRPMPHLVVIIDELADLMMVAGKEVETYLIRIAQMARAAGIHVVIATQRPSVDVVTGLIKVNFPSRIAFRVSSKVDSRTILDTQGAERLLGCGDMLFLHTSSPELRRVHGAYVSDKEVETVTDFLRDQGAPEYLDINEVTARNRQLQANDFSDELYDQVREYIKTTDEISISMIQRVYRIGFNRSARLIEKLELDGLIAPAQGSKPRRVLR